MIVTVKRLCETEIETSQGIVTPDNINEFASSVVGLCKFINTLETVDEIKLLTNAIQDNWNRYYESC